MNFLPAPGAPRFVWWSRLGLHMINAVLVVVGTRNWGSLTTLPGAGAVAALVCTAATATVVIERLPSLSACPNTTLLHAARSTRGCILITTAA
ncbi:hypothetical protein [Corynebacterium phoceense]|uniref:hypothetical protein n=1 Tax=Corynebacterium phoceense TaxID=1686286 RepID=UPI001D7477F2|nr:hypothetical protein [Corynebacterium phoceense]HJG44402.1 hypothetical protein [Corynebacterium phoceense]